MINIDKILIKADQTCDYLPLISTLSTIVNVVQKLVVKIFNISCSSSADSNNCYICHISKKSLWRCAATAVPGINLSVALYDFIKFVENDVNYAVDMKLYDEDYAIKNKQFDVARKMCELLRSLSVSYEIAKGDRKVKSESFDLARSIDYLKLILEMESSIDELDSKSKGAGSEPVKGKAKQCVSEMKEILKMCEKHLKECEKLLKESRQVLDHCPIYADNCTIGTQQYQEFAEELKKRIKPCYDFQY